MVVNAQKNNRPPFMPSRKRLSASDEELASFYKSLREYYASTSFDVDKAERQGKYYKRVAQICRIFAKLKGVTVLHGKRATDKNPLIYTANHIGSYDQFYIPSLLGIEPMHYLVKKKVAEWPIRWNLIYKPTGAIVVDLDSMSSWQQAKAIIARYLQLGKRVFIFAEGSRRGEDNMGKFSSGVAQIAQEMGVDVGTLAIKNCVRLFSQRPIVCMGETFSIGARENLKEATERIREGVVSAYNEILAYEKERWGRE